MEICYQPSPGDGGRASAFGFMTVFAAVTYLLAEYVWVGRSTVLIAYRHPGSVTLDGDILRIEAPGVVSRPVEIHRDWVETADRVEGYDRSAVTFNSGPVRKTCVLRLRQPIGIPQALTPPIFRDHLVRRPDCSVAVHAISLDVERLSAAVTAINRWAHRVSTTDPGLPPSAAAKSHAARNRRGLAFAALLVSMISLRFTLPSQQASS